MRDLEIAEVDPFDDTRFDAWYAAYLAAEQVSGLGSPWQLEELRVQMQEQGRRRWAQAYSGAVDGCVVTAGWIQTPLLDNLERAQISAHTVPDHRRRGHGTAMVRHLERVARERGRSVVGGETAWAHAAGADGSDEPGPEFARSVGFELALGDIKRELRLPVTEERLAALEAEAAPHHTAYTLRSWVGPVPDDLVEGWAALTSTLMTEAPTGDLEVEAEAIDTAVVREAEAMIAKQGRTKYNTVALDPAGEVVAYSDIAITIHEPDGAYQWGTLVRRDARGHRLGLAVKVANLRLMQREQPDVLRLITYNAEVNSHMVAVNDRLGFVPIARLGEFQKHLA
ncbi:MAG: family N-acetyltransferase [Nocardioides sp.]|nr:family N-acetyltransferase [Nocardioides sp.]